MRCPCLSLLVLVAVQGALTAMGVARVKEEFKKGLMKADMNIVWDDKLVQQHLAYRELVRLPEKEVKTFSDLQQPQQPPPPFRYWRLGEDDPLDVNVLGQFFDPDLRDADPGFRKSAAERDPAQIGQILYRMKDGGDILRSNDANEAMCKVEQAYRESIRTLSGGQSLSGVELEARESWGEAEEGQSWGEAEVNVDGEASLMRRAVKSKTRRKSISARFLKYLKVQY